MVEAGRRHGHHDPRYASGQDVRRKSHLRLVPDDGGDAIDSWEDEGGQFAPPPHVVPVPEPQPGLDWEVFSETYFPGRHRHDFEAVKAYEAYRATGAVPGAPGTDRLVALA